MVKKKLFDKCVGLLEESRSWVRTLLAEVTWMFEDVAEGEMITS